jgi:tryptophan synthase alpha chain
MTFDFNTFRSRRGNPPLVGYLPALYPNPTDYRTIVAHMASLGLVYLEIGIPCQDPYLDGPIIRTALSSIHKDHPDTLALIREVGALVDGCGIKAIAMAYNATLESAGIQAFVSSCVEGKIKGILIPDISENNRRELFFIAQASGIATVNFIPSGIERSQVESIIALTDGFLYLPSSQGSTGGQFDPTGTGSGRLRFVKELCRLKDLPVALGFGINTTVQAKQAVHMGAEAVIVGTALVKEAAKDPAAAVRFIQGFAPYLEDQDGMAAID